MPRQLVERQGRARARRAASRATAPAPALAATALGERGPREVGLAQVALHAHRAQRGPQPWAAAPPRSPGARPRRGSGTRCPRRLAGASALAIRRRSSPSVSTHWVTSVIARRRRERRAEPDCPVRDRPDLEQVRAAADEERAGVVPAPALRHGVERVEQQQAARPAVAALGDRLQQRRRAGERRARAGVEDLEAGIRVEDLGRRTDERHVRGQVVGVALVGQRGVERRRRRGGLALPYDVVAPAQPVERDVEGGTPVLAAPSSLIPPARSSGSSASSSSPVCARSSSCAARTIRCSARPVTSYDTMPRRPGAAGSSRPDRRRRHARRAAHARVGAAARRSPGSRGDRPPRGPSTALAGRSPRSRPRGLVRLPDRHAAPVLYEARRIAFDHGLCRAWSSSPPTTPARRSARTARRIGADTIVIGAHRPDAGVCQGVLRRAVPVVVVPR